MSPPGPLWEPFRATLDLSPKPIAMSHQILTYTELRQKIHDDLRIQHPEWSNQMADVQSVILMSHALRNY